MRLIAALASAALIVAASLAVGQAVLSLCGRRRPSALAGPVGLALLLAAAALTAGWGGRGTAIALVTGALTLAAVAALIARRELAPPDLGAGAAALLAALFASIPFIAAGHVGILGVGLVNDDMASHLLLADWIDERFRPEPRLIDQGYPLGPHALVAGLAHLLDARSIDVFAGLVVAIPALTAAVAHAALERLRPAVRIGAAALVALPYMAAAYLAQEAFKEPLIALFLLGFALLLPAVGAWREAIPLGVIAAGTTYVYSFPGLAWLGGVALVWAAIEVWRRRHSSPPEIALLSRRPVAIAVGTGIAVLLVLVAPDLDRLRDFVDFRALHPDRANEGGLGNLPGQLSPFEALGVWPTSEFRLSTASSGLHTAVLYGGGLFALVTFASALPRWIRRHGAAIPAALLAATALYVAALAFGTVYTAAKALAIAAPLIVLITVGGLLAPPRRWAALAAAGFALAAAGSSLLVLRQAPVAPEDHMAQLAQIRPLVRGEKLLFLGRDNFILYELRGSKPFTHVRNFYDPYFVEPDPGFPVMGLGSKFDFDSVPATALARFPYVLTTRASYASGPPPGYEVVKRTDSYELWRKDSSPIGRLPAERGPEPGRVGGCPPRSPRRASVFARAPVETAAAAWSSTTLHDGDAAAVELDLPAGEWWLSLQYDSTRALTLRAPGMQTTIPGNLDYRGSAPFWPAGRVEGGGPVTIEASVEAPPLAGRLLGAQSVAHLGAIAATAAAAPRWGGCGGYVDWYVR